MRKAIDNRVVLMLLSRVMKLLSTTPVSRGLVTKSALVAGAVMMAAAGPISVGQTVFADRFDDQIRAIQAEIDGYQSQAAALGVQAKTLKNELDNLNAQKNAIQAQLDLSQAKYDKLMDQIAQTEKKIASNKKALGKIIINMYVNGDVTPLEMLASSNNIGDYVDQQQMQAYVQDNLRKIIDENKALKNKLDGQKKDVERVLNDQKLQRDSLAGKEAEQAKLLADTQGQESAFQQLSSQKSKSIEELRSQQAAEMAARLTQYGGGGYTIDRSGNNGGYPASWANAYPDTLVDSWGMYNRECVSYVAFKVATAYGNMPYWGGVGNANQWLSNAYRLGIPTGQTAKVGAVAVLNGGPYGHVAWVDSVNGDGTINISQYNAYPDAHAFSKWYNLSPRFFDGYIYFGEW